MRLFSAIFSAILSKDSFVIDGQEKVTGFVHQSIRSPTWSRSVSEAIQKVHYSNECFPNFVIRKEGLMKLSCREILI